MEDTLPKGNIRVDIRKEEEEGTGKIPTFSILLYLKLYHDLLSYCDIIAQVG